MNDLISDIRSGKYTKLVILSGAGVSVNSGIPDYRSSNGIFSKLVSHFPQASRPETIFSRNFVNRYP